MSSLLRDITAGAESIAKVWARRLSAEVDLLAIQIDVSGEQDACEVSVVYDLALLKPSAVKDVEVVFDCMQTKLPIKRVEMNGTPVPELVGLQPLVSVTVASSVCNGPFSVRMVLAWPAISSDRRVPAQDCLLLPESLPLPSRVRHAGRALPPITVNLKTNSVSVAGVTRETGPPAKVGPQTVLLQGALIRRGQALTTKEDGCSLVVSPRLSALMSAPDTNYVAHLLESMVAFQSAWTGLMPGHLTIGLIHPEDHIGVRYLPAGSCVMATPKTLGLARADLEPANVTLTAQVAGAWWGAGCRPANRRVNAHFAALSFVAGMKYGSNMGDDVQQLLDNIERSARRSILRNWLKSWSGGLNFVNVMTQARTLYHRISDDPASLRVQTRKNWGKYVPSPFSL